MPYWSCTFSQDPTYILFCVSQGVQGLFFRAFKHLYGPYEVTCLSSLIGTDIL